MVARFQRPVGVCHPEYLPSEGDVETADTGSIAVPRKGDRQVERPLIRREVVGESPTGGSEPP